MHCVITIAKRQGILWADMLETETGWDWLLWYVNSVSLRVFKAQAQLNNVFFQLELSSGKLAMESRMCFNYFSPS